MSVALYRAASGSLAITLATLSSLVATACHDTGKDRGTCVQESVARCFVNEPRSQCGDGAFTDEDPTAGQTRCNSAGYDKIDPRAAQCEGGYSDSFDMQRGGTVPADMITSALTNACALQFTKTR